MMKILVAEDDVTSRSMLTALLRKYGFDPVAAGDGGSAWRIMQETDAPPLVILDWEMPVMDGLAVCAKIRSRKSSNPTYIILLTNRGEKTDIVEGLDAGANDYIAKPYNNEELLARIRVGKRMLDLQAELLEAKDALAHEAMHDPLTGVLNRRAIIDGLARELKRAERMNESLSIGMMDIDHFKKINDSHGHQVGDEVLCGFVKVIQKNIREYDLVGRYGGEEFLVIAPGSSGTPREGLYERLRTNVERFRTKTKAGEIGITVSIGVAGISGASLKDTILSAADEALYQAKNSGRNRVCFARVHEGAGGGDENLDCIG